MGYQLGIDLGTTYTAAAVCRTSDRRWVEPEVVTLGTRSTAIPSVIYVAPDGSLMIGEAAERRALTEPDRVVREFKRRIGDPTPIVVAGRRWAPEELSARLVRFVVDRVTEREGGPASRIAITLPASWGPHKKDLLAGALAAQSVTVTFLAEPQAAALHYATAERVGPGSTIAVYDLGGGTFDAAVVRKIDPKEAAAGAAGFGLLGRPEGLDRLGGVDFDEVVFEHVRDGLAGAFDDLDDTDPAVLSAVAQIRRECTDAKEALSSDTEASIPVLLPAKRGSVRLHRSEFEAMIRPQIAETVQALRKAVASARLEPSQLTAVLLVGGSSRIPLVAQMVSEQLDRPVAVDADPKNAIAKGASLAISPKPTASWPGVAIAPVAAAAGAAAAGAAASAHSSPQASAGAPALASTPAPPRPAHGAPLPQGVPQRPGVLPTPAAAAGFAGPPSRGPVGPSHESANHLLASNGGDVARRPAPPEPPTRAVMSAGWEFDQDPEPRRRPIGLLVGVGGLLAVIAIVVVVLLSNQGAKAPTVSPTNGGSSLTEATTTAPPAPAPQPGPNNNTPQQNNNNNPAPPKNDNPADKAPVTVPPANPPANQPTTKQNAPTKEPTAPPSSGGGATTNPGAGVTNAPAGNGGTSSPPAGGGTTNPGAEGGTPPVVPVGNGTPPTASVPVPPSAAPAAPAGNPPVVTT